MNEMTKTKIEKPLENKSIFAKIKFVLQDKDRILVTDSNDETAIKSQIDSVTDYAIQGKEKNPSLFGGC